MNALNRNPLGKFQLTCLPMHGFGHAMNKLKQPQGSNRTAACLYGAACAQLSNDPSTQIDWPISRHVLLFWYQICPIQSIKMSNSPIYLTANIRRQNIDLNSL